MGQLIFPQYAEHVKLIITTCSVLSRRVAAQKLQDSTRHVPKHIFVFFLNKFKYFHCYEINKNVEINGLFRHPFPLYPQSFYKGALLWIYRGPKLPVSFHWTIE